MTWLSIRIVTLAVASTIVAFACIADEGPQIPPENLDCHFRHTVEEVSSFEQLPTQLKHFLRSRWDPSEPYETGFAHAGEKFNSSGNPRSRDTDRRFIRGGYYQDRWFVFFEHGTPGGDPQLLVLNPDISQPSIFIRAQARGYLCGKLDTLIDKYFPAPSTGVGPQD